MNFRNWLGVELIEVSFVEKLVSAVGGGIAIFALFAGSRFLLPDAAALAVVASMGASAVLLFAVPHGPLSQPWPVVAGHGISALIGVACARWIPDPTAAAACAVGFSIGAMHHFKCIHPPGGATAFTAVMGGTAIQELGFGFVVFPILINALAMVAFAVAINGFFRWRRYPAALNRSPQSVPSDVPPPSHEEILTAVRSIDSFVDINEEDLLRLIQLLSHHHDPRRPASKRPPKRKSDLSESVR